MQHKLDFMAGNKWQTTDMACKNSRIQALRQTLASSQTPPKRRRIIITMRHSSSSSRVKRGRIWPNLASMKGLRWLIGHAG